MTDRSPLVLINGRPAVLPSGDTIPAAIVSGGGGGGGGTQQVFVQQTRPSSAGPWVWWVTDINGYVVNCIVNDGA